MGYSLAGTGIWEGSLGLFGSSETLTAGVARAACAAPASPVGPEAETMTSSSAEVTACEEEESEELARGEFSMALLGLSADAAAEEDEEEAAGFDAAAGVEVGAGVGVGDVLAAGAGEADGTADAAGFAADAAAGSSAAVCSVSGFFTAAGSSLLRYCEKI